MKKILVLSFLFLVSCGNNNLVDKEIQEANVLLDKNGNVLVDSTKNEANSGKTSESKENIKQICDTVKVGERFSLIQEKFGNAILLSESDLGDGKTTSFYYGKLGEEMCMILVKNGEIISKEYINI